MPNRGGHDGHVNQQQRQMSAGHGMESGNGRARGKGRGSVANRGNQQQWSTSTGHTYERGNSNMPNLGENGNYYHQHQWLMSQDMAMTMAVQYDHDHYQQGARGTSTGSTKNHEEMVAIQAEIKKEEDKQKKLKELKRIQRENARLQEAPIETASRTLTIDETILEEKKTKAKIERRRLEIASLLAEMKKASIVDVCFLVDCTGSMRSYIEEVKDKIKWLVKEISQKHEDVESLNLAFVGYRDLCDGDRNYSVLQFTKSSATFQDFVGKIVARGGCSSTADVMGGLDQVSKLSWSAPISRILIHACDVSGHGSKFHIRSGLSDPYPGGDPRGQKFHPETLIPTLMRENLISYYVFMRLTEYTDKMITHFKAIASGANPDVQNQEWLQEMPIDSAADLMTQAMESISSTISSMESNTVSGLLQNVASSSTVAVKEFCISLEIPSWSDIAPEPVHVFEHQLPRMAIHDFKAGRVDVTLLKKPLVVIKKDRLLKIAHNPFAKGGARLAYYGTDVTPFQSGVSNSPTAPVQATEDRLCVLKEFLKVGKRTNAKASYIEQIEVQAVGMHLALQFNKVKPDHTKDIKFLKESVISFHEREKPAYFTKENYIEGEYTKYNNNWGYVNAKEYHSLLHAFSHWTWHVTNGFLQVIS